ncbi:MAG: HD domain-containing protein, partial [Clostridia bacterium]|nr:HD domain-containing protein [Clostridia bacterium]
MQIPTYAMKAMDLLRDAGFECYAVGGCVRDSLLGKTPNDWDITTIALPEETKEVFSGYRVIETGIKHGTVTVLIDDEPLEITTYRIDGEYLDNRHPSGVTFTRNLHEDLARRDFTINALALSADGEIVDEFGGKEDLERGIIKCVGSPDKRFNEDALRIMRALRFSATLDFDIDPATSESIHKNRELLSSIAVERVLDELLKLLVGAGPRVVDILISYRDVFAVIIPELEPCFDFDQQNKHHIYDVYDHIAHSVGEAEPLPDVRLAMLLHDIGKPHCFTVGADGMGHFYSHADIGADITADILKRFKVSNEFYDTVWALVKYHYYPIEPNLKSVRRRLAKFGPELLDKILLVKLADNFAHNMETGDYSGEIYEVRDLIPEAMKHCFSIKDLAISGNDLIDMGVEKGPRIGEILTLLLDEVMDEKLPNEREKLIERV